MQWRSARRSTNIEDRRGMRLGPGMIGGGLGSIVLVFLVLFLGGDPSLLLNPGNDSGVPAVGSSPADDSTRDFVAAVVGYTEDTWSEIFQEAGRVYRPPTMVLFTGAVESACGFGQSAMGPFYCPPDEKVYLDLSFFQELRDRFQAPGDFAQAYVIAHEVGHHVQNLLGVSGRTESLQRSSQQTEANRLSVQLELQADCFAGVWARRTEVSQQGQSRSFLEVGDIEEALQAASMIGDDKLQMRSQGYVIPETFTHGSAEQRMSWFRQGLQAGDLSGCNTFR